MKSRKVSSTNHQRGFTMIEVIVVVGIIAISTGIGMIMSMDALSRGTIFSERDLLASTLVGSRTRAMANVDESPQGVYIETTSITTFEGSTYTAGNPTNRIIPRTMEATITGLNLIIFSQLSGDVASAGTITLAQGGASTTISIGPYGRIEW